jgi:hypothetical protein
MISSQLSTGVFHFDNPKTPAPRDADMFIGVGIYFSRASIIASAIS